MALDFNFGMNFQPKLPNLETFNLPNLTPTQKAMAAPAVHTPISEATRRKIQGTDTPVAPVAQALKPIARANPFSYNNPAIMHQLATQSAGLHSRFQQQRDEIARDAAMRGTIGTNQEQSLLRRLSLDEDRALSGADSAARADNYQKAAMWDDAEQGRVDSLLDRLMNFQQRDRQFDAQMGLNRDQFNATHSLARDQFAYGKDRDAANREAQTWQNGLSGLSTILGLALAPTTGGASVALPSLLKLLEGAGSGNKVIQNYSGYSSGGYA